MLARRFPKVVVDPEPIFIRDGRISTSAGVTAGIDLALALVEEDLGRDVVGHEPGRYVDRARLETARRLLEDAGEGIEQISRTCGYGTPEAMRRAFLRTLGVGPAEYRRRF